MAKFEQDLADYLQERMKPGLNRGAIPLLARSIAKDLAHRSSFSSASDDTEAEDEPDDAAEEEPTSEADDEPSAEAEEDGPDAEAEDEPGAETEDEPDAEAEDGPDAEEDDGPDAEPDDEALDFEDEMHQLRAEFGEDWMLRFSVQGGDAWLTAEKAHGSQRLGLRPPMCSRRPSACSTKLEAARPDPWPWLARPVPFGDAAGADRPGVEASGADRRGGHRDAR